MSDGRFEPGNAIAVRHGAFSERRLRPVLDLHRRRTLRRLRLKAGDLDPVGRAYLEHYVRLTAKIILLDEWMDENAIVRADGSVVPALGAYTQLTGQAVKSLSRLADHLRVEGIVDPMVALRELRDRAA